MHYYIFSSLIFKDGQIKNAYNQCYSSEKAATLIDFKEFSKSNHAGPPDSYSAIIIGSWQEIDEPTYKMYNDKWNRDA